MDSITGSDVALLAKRSAKSNVDRRRSATCGEINMYALVSDVDDLIEISIRRLQAQLI